MSLRWIAALAPALLVGCDLLFPPVVPSGSITVKNEDPQAWELLVTTDERCTLGLHTRIGSNTQTTYDVELGAQNYVCVDERGPGMPVDDGGEYVLRGGRLSPR